MKYFVKINWKTKCMHYLRMIQLKNRKLYSPSRCQWSIKSIWVPSKAWQRLLPHYLSRSPSHIRDPLSRSTSLNELPSWILLEGIWLMHFFQTDGFPRQIHTDDVKESFCSFLVKYPGPVMNSWIMFFLVTYIQLLKDHLVFWLSWIIRTLLSVF